MKCKEYRELDCEAGSKQGRKRRSSDPVVPYGRDHRSTDKNTLGIAGLSPQEFIDGEVYLDVGSSHPGAVVGPKVGLFAH